MKFIENVGWVEDDTKVYPSWFQMWLKERNDEKRKTRDENIGK